MVPAAPLPVWQKAPPADGSVTRGRTSALRHRCQPRQDTPQKDKAASQDIPGLGGWSGRRGCGDTERRWWEAKPDYCTQENWGLGDLWGHRSFSIPFPCYLLLQQLAHSCATALASAGLFLITGDSRDFPFFSGSFRGDFPLRHDCNPVLFMPLQLLQAISLTFSRRVKIKTLRAKFGLVCLFFFLLILSLCLLLLYYTYIYTP